MGMTFWIHVLNGRKISENQNDLSALYNAAESLDALCKELGVEKVSKFADHTDLEYNMAGEFGGDDKEEPPTDPETGWPYSIDDMHWFDGMKGIKSLTALQKRLQNQEGLSPSLVKSRKRILEDLSDCLEQLKAAPKGCKFHLEVVM